ncbi:MAG: NAD(P)H-dependent oxidoreductase subunit E [Candidatus Omnitrophota bacterium]
MIKNIEKRETGDQKEFAKKLRLVDTHIRETVSEENRKGALMGVLHKAQNVFGYLPREAMELISQRLSVPTAHIYGMATFYNYFSLKPKAKFQICVCKGTACYVGGGARILQTLKKELKINEGDITADGLFGLNITRCLGCCGLSPVMQVNDDIYVRMVPEKVKAILETYRRLDKVGKKKKAVRRK